MTPDPETTAPVDPGRTGVEVKGPLGRASTPRGGASVDDGGVWSRFASPLPRRLGSTTGWVSGTVS